MLSEIERLRRDRDAWLDSWGQKVAEMEQARRHHEIEADALRQVIRRQDAELTDLWARMDLLREHMAGERAMQLHDDIDALLCCLYSNSLLGWHSAVTALVAERDEWRSDLGVLLNRIEELKREVAGAVAQRDEAMRKGGGA